jgi:site-specific DNA-methyltransferase (adenine-specific)
MEYKDLIGGAVTDKINIYNCDCMELLKQTPDNYYSLALVDPPYGIGASEMQMGTGKNKKYNKGKKWDNETPTKEYFNELFRVSKNQIIWGGNYFDLPLIKGWIIWDKLLNKDVSFADGEMAWNNFDKVLKIIKHQYSGFIGADNERIHPTQKPIKLYHKLLDLYAKQGDKILDTHLGSMSIAIACHDYGFDLTGCELDVDYFNKGMQRINNHVAQTKLF